MSQVNLYLDLTQGVSGDMLRRALLELLDVEDRQLVESWALEYVHPEETHGENHGHHAHEEESHGHHHRSFREIENSLSGSSLPPDVRDLAIRMYTILGEAEARVHGETLDTVHFHEVGRPEAVRNLIAVAGAFCLLRPGRVECSVIYDGRGTVQCSHGEIPVPVPAVRAMMDRCNLDFATAERDMEMVTPTGLAAILALETAMRTAPPENFNIHKLSQAPSGLSAVLWSKQED